jgi:hypothetical protein
MSSKERRVAATRKMYGKSIRQFVPTIAGIQQSVRSLAKSREGQAS